MRRGLKFAAGPGLAVILGTASIGTADAQVAGPSGLGFGWSSITFGFAAPYFKGSNDGFDGNAQTPTVRHSAPAHASDPAYAYTGDPAYYAGNAGPAWRERQLRGQDY